MPEEPQNPKNQVTELLLHLSQGENNAVAELLPLVYQELRRIAGAHMKRELASHTLQPTALVHEAYLRLIEQKNVQWQNRSHFFGIAAQLMRRILIDHARKKKAEKRGGDQVRITLEEGFLRGSTDSPTELLELDEALNKLAELDKRQAQIVELRCFGGLSVEETAKVLEISAATVKRDWTVAKAWLHRHLSEEA